MFQVRRLCTTLRTTTTCLPKDTCNCSSLHQKLHSCDANMVRSALAWIGSLEPLRRYGPIRCDTLCCILGHMIPPLQSTPVGSLCMRVSILWRTVRPVRCCSCNLLGCSLLPSLSSTSTLRSYGTK